jgi:hypothetical protein
MTINDSMTASGAAHLALTIRKYWADRGESVSTWVDSFKVEDRTTLIYIVCSDLVNGLPSQPKPLARAA